MDHKQVVDKVMEEIAREAVREVIQKHAGYGIDDGIREIIRNRAKEVLKEPEFETMIREQLIRWIQHT